MLSQTSCSPAGTTSCPAFVSAVSIEISSTVGPTLVEDDELELLEDDELLEEELLDDELELLDDELVDELLVLVPP